MPVSYLIAKNNYLRNLLKAFFFLFVNLIRQLRIYANNPGTATVIITLHKLGDSVFTIPAIKEIVRNWGDDCYLFCFEETKPIFMLFFRKESIITFGHSDFYLNDRIAKSIVRKTLNELRPGRIYDLTGSVRSASILFPFRTEYIIGMNEIYFKSIYTDFVPRRTNPHIIDIYLDVIHSIISGSREKLKEFPVEVDENGYILIHPFAGWAAKEWNLNKFIRLAAHLNEFYEVVIISPPQKIMGDISREIKFLGVHLLVTENTGKLIDAIKNCSIIISNDSGPIYIANLIGKPTFTIYGPTNPKFHIPYGKNHRYFHKEIKCSPDNEKKYCFTDGGRNGCPSYECMNSVSVDEVEKKLIPFIKELNIKRKALSK